MSNRLSDALQAGRLIDNDFRRSHDAHRNHQVILEPIQLNPVMNGARRRSSRLVNANNPQNVINDELHRLALRLAQNNIGVRANRVQPININNNVNQDNEVLDELNQSFEVENNEGNHRRHEMVRNESSFNIIEDDVIFNNISVSSIHGENHSVKTNNTIREDSKEEEDSKSQVSLIQNLSNSQDIEVQPVQPVQHNNVNVERGNDFLINRRRRLQPIVNNNVANNQNNRFMNLFNRNAGNNVDSLNRRRDNNNNGPVRAFALPQIR